MLPCLTACTQEDSVRSLRIMTYNIRHGEGMDNEIDLDRQALIMLEAGPDVIGLQEVDSVVKRSGYIDQAAHFGDRLSMYSTFGPAIPLTRGKYGVAILSKEKPWSVHNIPLPGTEPRTLLVCEFFDYVFACTHLDLNDSCRLASLAIIEEEAASWDKPFFICGDWNDEPSSTLIKQMKKDNFVFLNNLTANNSNFTFPARNPKSIIDYIACYGRKFKALKKRQVINAPEASDHRPVLVEVTLPVDAASLRRSPVYEKDPREGTGSWWYDIQGRKTKGKRSQGNGKRHPSIYVVDGKKIAL